MKKGLITSVLALAMLISFTACTKKVENPPAPDVKIETTTSDPMQIKSALVYGKWAAENGPQFEFAIDGSYSYYEDKNNLTDNYYKGKATILNGTEALADLKITASDFLNKYSSYAGTPVGLFSVKLNYETYMAEGTDKSSTLDKEGSMKYLFMLSENDNNKATIINMADSTSVELTRVK